MSDEASTPRLSQPTAKDTVRLPRMTKPSAKDTVRLNRPPAKTSSSPQAGASLEDFVQQQKPHIDPPPQ